VEGRGERKMEIELTNNNNNIKNNINSDNDTKYIREWQKAIDKRNEGENK